MTPAARFEEMEASPGASPSGPMVSMVSDAKDTATEDADIATVLASIRGGKWRSQIEHIRGEYQKAVADGRDPKVAVGTLKKALPGILWSGTFSKRANDGLVTHSGIICADIDHIEAQLEQVRTKLVASPYVLSVFRSPTDTGLKGLFRVKPDAALQRGSFRAVQEHVRALAGVEIDEACKDVARLCFVSFDPETEVNLGAEELAPLPEPEKKPAPKRATAAPAQPGTRQEIAERILGPIQWTSETEGFCVCPGQHLHTTANAERDCKVCLNGAPTLTCFHNSCRGILDGVNHSLRSQIGKIEAPLRERQGHSPFEDEVSLTAARIKLTLRSPDEIIAMRFDDSDIILGDRLLALFQTLAILAAGGIGKSRLLLQLIAAVVTGRKFLNMVTGASHLRWLILQTENSNRRLQADLDRLKTWLGLDDWARFNAQVAIHTIENDSDGFVSLDSPENQMAIADAIKNSNADGVVVDPLNDFGIGDLNKDADMKATLQTLSRLCRCGNPQRPIITLHHALTGRGGAVKATGYDRASFARNSKVLHAWARGQINLAPVDADNNDRLIVACGKCSNGPEFPAFGIRLNPQTFIYECDPSIDVAAWEKEISGQSNREPLINPERVRELCRLPMAKGELAKLIMADCGCYRGSAYRYITRAEQARKIRFNKDRETYART